MKPDKQRKLVVVGDGGCGKTCLLTVYVEQRFPEEYVPTVFETINKCIPNPLEPTKSLDLILWDTAGQEDFDRLRPLSYNETDVVLIVFAVNHRVSLDNVSDKWYPEVSHFMETVPIILVGTKSDLRTEPREISLMASQGQTPVSTVEGEQVAREIGAKRYLECSAKLGKGVDYVFDAAVREALGRGSLKEVWKAAGSGKKGNGERKKKCLIL